MPDDDKKDEPKKNLGTNILDAIQFINAEAPEWAPEDRVENLAPYLDKHGDPLREALLRLSPEQRKNCGIDDAD